ncbi:hypothetical protein BC833DRAFT_624170 [Globomyces pollinis-pini]|nr:hypothetical protein BC833DRAFT_624170 [Globomyces pollinis-pini]
MSSEKESQFQPVSSPNLMHADLVDDEDVSLDLHLTLKDATNEYIQMEQQESLLLESEKTILKLQKSLTTLNAEILGLENESSYLIQQKTSLNQSLSSIKFFRNTEEMKKSLAETENRQAIVEKLLLEARASYNDMTSERDKVQADVQKLQYVKNRIENLFNRVFRRPNSTFEQELRLFNDCQKLKSERASLLKELTRVEKSRTLLMQMIRTISQKLNEEQYLTTMTSINIHNANAMFLVRIQKDYWTARKVNSSLPPATFILGSNIETDPESIECGNYSHQDLKLSITKLQTLTKDLLQQSSYLKLESSSLKAHLDGQLKLLDEERRRILRGVALNWDRRRLTGIYKDDMDLPPPYHHDAHRSPPRRTESNPHTTRDRYQHTKLLQRSRTSVNRRSTRTPLLIDLIDEKRKDSNSPAQNFEPRWAV